jgi:hypothetical protein
MTFNKNWNIHRKWKSNGYVTIVQGQVMISHSDFVGVETPHGFQIDISNHQISDETDDATILTAIQDFMEPHLEASQGNHYTQLQYMYNIENSDEVDIVVTEQMIITERERRLALGFDYDFGDSRGIHRIGTTPEDRKGWEEVTDASNAAIALGNTEKSINIFTDTGPVQITAMEWQQILSAATTFRQPIWQASFLLNEMDPKPSNYLTHSLWP